MILIEKTRGLLCRIPPHLFVAGSGWVGRLVSAATGIFMIRFLTQSLGTQQYAAYAIFGGLLGWFSLVDMGLGPSLQNHISERRAKGEPYDQFVTVSAFLGLLFFLVFIVALILSSSLMGEIVLRKFDLFSNYQPRGIPFSGCFWQDLAPLQFCQWLPSLYRFYGERRGHLSLMPPPFVHFSSGGLNFGLPAFWPPAYCRWITW